jgi:tRNA(Ile)-lysidine synthase
MLPALEALGLTIERLGTFARRMDDASVLIHSDAEAVYPQIVTPLTATRVELSAQRFAMQNPAVAAAVLGSVLGLVAGDRRAPPLGPLELLARRLQQLTPLKGITLHGCLVTSDGEAILIQKEKPRRAVSKRKSSNTAN